MKTLYAQLAKLARQYGARRLVPVRVARQGRLPPHQRHRLGRLRNAGRATRAHFWLDAQELPTLLKLDIVQIGDGTDPKLLANIEKDGVTLMGSFSEKYSKLRQAVTGCRKAWQNTGKLPPPQSGTA